MEWRKKKEADNKEENEEEEQDRIINSVSYMAN